jgi:flavin reductase (DIM6/NTAB) family NADH-FMN oxidoreductase RutF
MDLRHDMLTHGVYVVCAQHQGKRGGLAVAWATQVGSNAILICVGQQSATRELILASRSFGLSILARDQLDVARRFGSGSSRRIDKLEVVPYHTGQTGSPLLDDCAVAFDCEVRDVFELGTQRLIVGHILSAERRRGDYEPLIYKEEDY